jgi:hypothetical protein
MKKQEPKTQKYRPSTPVTIADCCDIAYKDPSPTKTTGIKIRGTGAATKGVMARGPMA